VLYRDILEAVDGHMTHKFEFIDIDLESRKVRNLFRRLRAVTPQAGPVVSLEGAMLLNFCSNDYLGLSQHPLLRERAAEFMARFGAGSTASRLICGNLACFGPVEEKLAALKGSESALILNAGYQSNVALLSTLADRDALILSDAYNHNSLIRGAMLARCRVERFGHNDLTHLKMLLAASRKTPYSRVLIVTESVFSMDGDRCRVDALVELATDYNAILYVDEAHATGVFGPAGMGLTVGKKVDVVMGTFGKGLGGYGSYVACSKKLRDYLINRCYGFIYTTGLPPAVIGTIDAALDLVPAMDDQRRRIQENADYLRSSLSAMGWDTGKSDTQIVPVVVGNEDDTMSLSAHLEKNGVMATGIRPPTVAPGQSRIRLTLTALHTRRHVDQLIDAFKTWRAVNEP
jgi:8-amino-7-oxononanoate synthase